MRPRQTVGLSLLVALLTFPAAVQGAEEVSRPIVPSVPAKLDAIQATVTAINSAVNLINPALPQPVTLATGSVFVVGKTQELECRATNVGPVPVIATITIFNSSSGEVVETRDFTVAPKKSEQINHIFFDQLDSGIFWCGFTFDGPLNAVRAHLAVYGNFPELRILAISEAR